MKIFIPTIGDRIELLEDWTFALRKDSRNWDLVGSHQMWKLPEGMPITVPAGTILKIHRIYIRGNAREFDSVTFHAAVRQPWTGGERGKRFFAGLDDVNKIECRRVT